MLDGIEAICIILYSISHGPSSLSGKALFGYGLDGPGIRGVKIFLYSFVSRLVLGFTQPPIKWVPGPSLGVKAAEHKTSPLPLPSAMAVYMCALQLYTPWAFMACNRETFYSINQSKHNALGHHFKAGVFNQRPAGRLRPSGEFWAAREGYFTKYNALWRLSH